MRYAVTIDWEEGNPLKMEGYTYVKLKAQNLKDAMLEAPYVANIYARKALYKRLGTHKGLADLPSFPYVWCIRIVKQSLQQEKKWIATDMGIMYTPGSFLWRKHYNGKIWYPVNVELQDYEYV